MNLAISVTLHNLTGLNPFISFLCGTLCNQLFHLVYYHLVYVNQEIRTRNSWPVQLLLYLCVALAGLVPLWVGLRVLGLSFVSAALATIGLLSVLNTVLIRVSTFSSAQLAEIEYRELDEAFYDDQTDVHKVNRIRAWFHRSRFRELGRWVSAHHRPGMRIADLGCGNCLWNDAQLPVTGVDINEKMLQWAMRNHRIREYRVSSNLADTGLPAEGFDMVIMSETLEHLIDLSGTLAEVRRILKPGGTFLITVPYDFFLGPFFVLFNVNCFYQGYCRGSRYHRLRCGHVNHFTRKQLVHTLAGNGFDVREVRVVNGLSLYAAAVKAPPAATQPPGRKGN